LPVILIDANILIYASNDSARQHVTARNWLDRQLALRLASAFSGSHYLHS